MSGQPSYVQLPPNSTGAEVRTIQETDSLGNVVQAEVIHIADIQVISDLLRVWGGRLLSRDEGVLQNLVQMSSQLQALLRVNQSNFTAGLWTSTIWSGGWGQGWT